MIGLEALAQRCEAATGPDRELEHHIGGALRWYDDHTILESVPRYTASLDAAMTLVPEGHHWQVGNGIDTGSRYADGHYAWCDTGDTGDLVLAASAALALCAAALRAKARQ